MLIIRLGHLTYIQPSMPVGYPSVRILQIDLEDKGLADDRYPNWAGTQSLADFHSSLPVDPVDQLRRVGDSLQRNC